MASSRLNALEAEAKTWISAILEEPLDDQRLQPQLKSGVVLYPIWRINWCELMSQAVLIHQSIRAARGTSRQLSPPPWWRPDARLVPAREDVLEEEAARRGGSLSTFIRPRGTAAAWLQRSTAWRPEPALRHERQKACRRRHRHRHRLRQRRQHPSSPYAASSARRRLRQCKTRPRAESRRTRRRVSRRRRRWR